MPSAERSALPVISRVVSVAALLGVLGLTGWLLATGAFAGGGEAPLTGQLTGVRPGTPLRGDALADELTQIIGDDGGDVTEMRCPDTPAVRQGVVTVCHGSISGASWAVVVFFEDTEGRFTAQPL